MKKTGYEILGLVKDGKEPPSVKYKNSIYKFRYGSYKTEEGIDLHLDHEDMLNEEIEIIDLVWEPKERDTYYFINNKGYTSFDHFDNCIYSKERYKNGNCFETKKEAEKVLEKVEIYTQLKRYAISHNTEKIDWNNGKQKKWFISYDFKNLSYLIVDVETVKDVGIVYFTSEELCKQAIKEIGEDNTNKLFDIEGEDK